MKQEKQGSIVIIGSLPVFYLLSGTNFDSKQVTSSGGNVTILLNATNTAPTILSIIIDDTTQSHADQIDLTANSVVEVIYSASVVDLNGYCDIVNAAARIHDTAANSNFDEITDNNAHLRNNSCIEFSQHIGLNNNAACVCRFDAKYYSNNLLECNINVSDNGLTSNNSVIKEMTLEQRAHDSAQQFAEGLNLSFFRIRVPGGIASCNGTIAFEATNDAATY